MTPKRLYSHFCEEFPWFVPDVIKYTENRNDGGIDIFLKSGDILNYKREKKSWILKKG